MDWYDYDPSAYYASEDESPSAEPKIHFEFGARSASFPIGASIGATNSSALVQTIELEDPVQDVNTQATLWIGTTVTIFVVTVRI
jgi:hypothetical protein